MGGRALKSLGRQSYERTVSIGGEGIGKMSTIGKTARSSDMYLYAAQDFTDRGRCVGTRGTWYTKSRIVDSKDILRRQKSTLGTSIRNVSYFNISRRVFYLL